MMVNSLEATEAAKQYATVKVLAECPDWNGDQAAFITPQTKHQICAPLMDSPFDVRKQCGSKPFTWLNGAVVLIRSM